MSQTHSNFRMKCIVTAGPTYEELDDVRRLTNFSTGALGTELAGFLAARGHEVVLLRGHYATCRLEPPGPPAQVFTTGADLRRRLRRLAEKGADALFHAAAVGDFKFGKIWSPMDGGELREIRLSKISTREGVILAELRPAAKIIVELRGWFPEAYLAGWKYELEGRRAEAVARGREQLAENQTDACVVNGRAYGKGFGLVTRREACEHLRDKPALFAALLARAEVKAQKR
jgi:phosphopantothenoylcysteine decarboxylase/phosphopantothenate--cysteine ligase